MGFLRWMVSARGSVPSWVYSQLPVPFFDDPVSISLLVFLVSCYFVVKVLVLLFMIWVNRVDGVGSSLHIKEDRSFRDAVVDTVLSGMRGFGVAVGIWASSESLTRVSYFNRVAC